ncbi:unnamed protein product [Owenia fusiformis]|uniref:BRISC and BRCA1-A complex member 2 n=1 Tax=Owenia fusiformis TaxID=6347 RepID=A0A8J1U3N2_OWEFU|nr:unnamed protein product [Owenia fusiformis]
MGASVIGKFEPQIGNYVECLLTEGKIGICEGNIRLTDITSGCNTLQVEKGPCCDRFKMLLPYGGHSITWEVLFNSCYPEEPPDFIFGNDEQFFLPDLFNLVSLLEWDHTDPKSLLYVVQELLDQYKSYQHNLIEAESRLKFEYQSIAEELGKDAIEVHVMKKGQYKIGPISFLIKLDVDFSRIPAYLTKDNPGEDSAVLLVNFSSSEGGRVTSQLYLSPRVEVALGGSAGLRIPSFPSNGCMIDYVPSIKTLLTNKVDQTCETYEKRKEYVSAFLSHYGRSVQEYDTESFSKLTFLFDWRNFSFLVSIDIPRSFPQDCPTFTFHSVYHELNGLPYSMKKSTYPYSPRWKGTEMAERARAVILETVEVFQQNSIKEGSAT